MEKFEDKIVLITGATSGIGEACAIEFAENGATVIVTGRNEERGNDVVEKINAKRKCAFFVKVDVSNDNDIDKLFDFIVTNFGKLDILYNNSGIYPVEKGMEGTKRTDISQIIDINFSSMLLMVQKMLPLLIQSRGVIINNASIGGMDCFVSGQSFVYTGSKAAVIKFSKMMAKKYGDTCRVNCICPGTIQTPIFKNFNEERMSAKIPMHRTGRPEEVAKVVAFLASSDASYVNGAVLTIDGGQSLGA